MTERHPPLLRPVAPAGLLLVVTLGHVVPLGAVLVAVLRALRREAGVLDVPYTRPPGARRTRRALSESPLIRTPQRFCTSYATTLLVVSLFYSTLVTSFWFHTTSPTHRTTLGSYSQCRSTV